MQKLPLSLVRPGMVLAKAVARADGIAVAAQGTELSQAHLDRFDTMGVDAVVVEGNPVDLEGAAGDMSYEKRAERLDHLFRKHAGDKWMQQIKKLLYDYFKLRAAGLAAARAAAEPPREG
ncbi:hypothetical protein [Desulfolutivibrio sp.]|uniref:hypothetical protein n=1 Tax=Desulfolutivibrio sp. TaxID=2773296 RepID=UPI002F9630F2